jgi:hypothetical protein
MSVWLIGDVGLLVEHFKDSLRAGKTRWTAA